MRLFERSIESSVYVTIRRYFSDLWQRMYSIFGSMFAALPYLFNAGDLKREVTEQYPDPISSKTVDDLPPRTRGLLYNDIDRCTGCKECEKVCPTECIAVKTEPGKDENTLWVSVFDIDLSKCVFCGLCTEICAPQSLVHTKGYEASVGVTNDLITSFGKGPVTAELRHKWNLPGSESGERT